MKTNRLLKIPFLLLLSICLFLPQVRVGSAGNVLLPEFPYFVRAVTNGQAGVVRGVYVPDVFAYRVIQQPQDEPGYVSQTDGVVTQFNAAAQYQVTGLLAHNFLAGASFFALNVGQEVRIVYGDGQVNYYVVDRVARFEALSPDSGVSDFIDLSTSIIYTAQEVFALFYQGEDHVTFQTCIQHGSVSSWGRLFVTAAPVSDHFLQQIPTFGLYATLGQGTSFPILVWLR